HADIFFYITTIAVVVLTVLLIVLFYYFVKIAKHLERTARRLKEESDRIIDDVSMVRESIENSGGKAISFLKFIFGSFIHSREKTKEGKSEEGGRSGRTSRKTKNTKSQ
ncbi:MAG: hypothetical protein WCO09_03510, partial [bacterium]